MSSMSRTASQFHSDIAHDEVILGVDTHKDMHVAAVITVLGALVDTRCFPATAAGYCQLLAWTRTMGMVERAGVECTGSYGAALARYLHSAGVEVIEVNQSTRLPVAAGVRPMQSTRRLLPVLCCPAGPMRQRSRRRASGDVADVQAGQGIRHQGAYPDDQPTQGRPRRRHGST